VTSEKTWSELEAGVHRGRSSPTRHHLPHARKIPVAYGWAIRAILFRVALKRGPWWSVVCASDRPRGDRALVDAPVRPSLGHGEVVGRPRFPAIPARVSTNRAAAVGRRSRSVRQAAPDINELTSAGFVCQPEPN
jgi:hypothetical protein